MNYQLLLEFLRSEIKQFNHIQDQKNIVLENLQKLILKTINTVNNKNKLIFLGGTNLRIVYQLDRFSEDLDFALELPESNFDFSMMLKSLTDEFSFINDLTISKVNTNTAVYKTFVNFPHILFDLGLSTLTHEKIKVKLELDINPPAKALNTFSLVKSWNEDFVLHHQDLATTFAGKIGAVLLRDYAKGRDFYDLLWYFQNNKKLLFNLDYLNEVIKQSNQTDLNLYKSHLEVINDLIKKVETVFSNSTEKQKIIEDLMRFILVTGEKKVFTEAYINTYADKFRILANQYSNFLL